MKVLGFFLVPSNLIASILLAGLVLVFIERRAGSVVLTGATIALCAAALSPLGNLLLTPLEQRFPEFEFPQHDVDGIIVLGGSYDSQSHGYVSTIVLGEDTEPMAVMVELARRYSRAKIIFSGGTEPPGLGPSEASIAKQYFISFGIAADRILVEEQSVTTEQNARFSADLIHPTLTSRWLLVTSAYHMPRAMGAFRKAGFNVSAFPVGLRTHGWRDLWWPESTATDNMRRVDIAVHEWLGLVFYRVSGYSSAWFSGPRVSMPRNQAHAPTSAAKWRAAARSVG